MSGALRVRRPGGPPLLLSWGAVAGRSQELARALGGEVVTCFPPSESWRPPVAIRWALSALRTIAVLACRRPRSVVVTNPPVFAGLVASAYGRLTGARIVLDDHPGAFGAQGDPVAARLQPIHRWLVPRVAACLVTAEPWVEQIEKWGGRGIVLHEAPDTWELAPIPGGGQLDQVLYVCTFARDEPVASVLEAAREVPELRILMTGDRRRLPPEVAARVPANVHLVGLLPQAAYRRAVLESGAVMALTTEPTSAMRAAFEAVWAGRPLIVSDWPLLAELFPDAVRVANDATSIRDGLRQLLTGYRQRCSQVVAARDRQLGAWEKQLALLREAVGSAPEMAP